MPEPHNWTIWKFTLETKDRQTVKMPKGARILSLQMQNGNPQVWALVDQSSVKACRRIAIYGTGHPVGENGWPGEFVGTYQMNGGTLVFHVFDLGEYNV